jgi:hypothetical protein
MKLREAQVCKPMAELRAELRATMLEYLIQVTSPLFNPEAGW